MAKDTFGSIAEMYEDQVKKNDKAGYAEKLKVCTELFFRMVNEEYALKDSPVHFNGIQFLDGYFIFGFGTNSVIHFRIDECPGWLFGIWWTIPDESNQKQKYISGELFAQYEENIDKFKPSYSSLCSTITSIPDGDRQSCSCYAAAKMISFIRDEPYLAFCRDYCNWNYNEKYHTRDEAKEVYGKYRIWRDNEVKYTKECDSKILVFVKDKILPLFTDAKIRDLGENWSPRYEVVAPLEKNKDVVKKCGSYDWFDADDEEGKKTMEEFNALQEECYEIANKYEFSWFSPIDSIITFIK